MIPEWIARRWCRWLHRRAMWPIKGHYLCRTCLRSYEVQWDVLNERRSQIEANLHRISAMRIHGR